MNNEIQPTPANVYIAYLIRNNVEPAIVASNSYSLIVNNVLAALGVT